jgi:hypothetical protein
VIADRLKGLCKKARLASSVARKDIRGRNADNNPEPKHEATARMAHLTPVLGTLVNIPKTTVLTLKGRT